MASSPSELEQPITRAEWLRGQLARRRLLIQELTDLETFLLEYNAITRRACVSGKRKAREAHSPSVNAEAA